MIFGTPRFSVIITVGVLDVKSLVEHDGES